MKEGASTVALGISGLVSSDVLVARTRGLDFPVFRRQGSMLLSGMA
jgi:hypothetical protein